MATGTEGAAGRLHRRGSWTRCGVLRPDHGGRRMAAAPAGRDIRLVEARVDPGKLLLDYSSARAPGAQPEIPALLRCLALQEAKARFLACEEAIVAGGPRARRPTCFGAQLAENPGTRSCWSGYFSCSVPIPAADEEVLQICKSCRASIQTSRPPCWPKRPYAAGAASSTRRRLATGDWPTARTVEADSLEELLAILAAGRMLGGR